MLKAETNTNKRDGERGTERKRYERLPEEKKYKSRQNNINGEGVRQAKEGVKKRLDINE